MKLMPRQMNNLNEQRWPKKCCGHWDAPISISDPECKYCPNRQHYVNAAQQVPEPATAGKSPITATPVEAASGGTYVKCQRCGYEGNILRGYHTCMTTITLDEYESLKFRLEHERSFRTIHETEELAERARADALQARVDELMLEYCPNEMTPKQKAMPQVISDKKG